ncbi:MAG: 3'-5' exonuclease [Myxococcales bacterium]|nr:3'-5' exonuclease [Myxococcales bacterium]
MTDGRKDRTAPPPAGPPWDVPLAEAPLLFVDLEMDGLDVARHRVIELCLERVVGGEVQARLETLVCPFTEAELAEKTSIGNEHVHGITRAMLAGARPFDDVVTDVEALLDGAILVAHAASWDVRFLEMELVRAGRQTRAGHYLDTLILARRALALSSHSMESLCAHFGIVRPKAHRAGDDVAALRRVFEETVKVLAPVSARDLWEVRIAERMARTAIVEACSAALERGAPVRTVYRPSRRKPEALDMVFTELRTDLDPPRVIGYQLPGRGRRELRTDRILTVSPIPDEHAGEHADQASDQPDRAPKPS